MSDDSNPESIQLERFLKVMNVILKDRRYQSEPESKILRAFQVLDPQNKGYLTEEEFRNYLCKEGNCKTAKELFLFNDLLCHPPR